MKRFRKTGTKLLTGLFIILSVCFSAFAEDATYIGGSFGTEFFYAQDPRNELIEYKITDVKSAKPLFWAKTASEFQLRNVTAGDTFTLHCSIKGYPEFEPDFSWCVTEGWIDCDDEGHVKILKTDRKKFVYLKPQDKSGTFPMDSRAGINVYPWNGDVSSLVNGMTEDEKEFEVMFKQVKKFCPWWYATGNSEKDKKIKFRYDDVIKNTKSTFKGTKYFHKYPYFNINVKKEGSKYKLEWDKYYDIAAFMYRLTPHYYIYQSTGGKFERLYNKYGSTATTHYMKLNKCDKGTRFIIIFQFGNDEYCYASPVYTYNEGSGSSASKTTVKTKKISGIKKKYTLKVGKKLQLKPVLTPKNSKQKIKYKSSNKKVATVSSKGKVTAKKSGKAIITITSGKKKVKTTIIVKKK